jgi:hypothetical protein
MGALIVLTAAFAAQATTAVGGAPATDKPAAASGPKAGQSTYVDVEGGVGYSTNPQLLVSSHTGGGFGRVALHAVHTRVSARTTTLISAYAENVTYTTHYGSQQSLSLFARHDAAVNEHLRVFGDLSANYQQGGQLDTRILVVPLVPPLVGLPGTPILLPGSADFLTVHGKEYQFAGHGGIQVSLSPRDDLSVSSGVERTTFHSSISSGLGRNSYTTVPVSLAYDRQLSERSTIGARLVAQDTEYDGPASIRTITPQLTGRTSLSPVLSLSGAIGVSFARVDDGVRTRNSTGLSADASLCSTTESGSLCASIDVSQETATVAGPSNSISGSVAYSRQLDADSTIALSLGVDHLSRPTSVIVGLPFSHATYYRASAEYSRRIGNRLFAGVDLAARKLAQTGPDPKIDFNGSLFIRYRFGDVH